MKIKRFFAADIRQAMRMVKDELGADAVIMSNRSVDGGVEIVAARDFDEQVIQKNLKEQSGQERIANRLKRLDIPELSGDDKPHHVVPSPRKRGNETETPNPIRRHLDQYLGYAEKVQLGNVKQTGNVNAQTLADKLKSVDKPAWAAPDVKKPAPAAVQPVPPAPTTAVPAATDHFLAEMRQEMKTLRELLDAKLSNIAQRVPQPARHDEPPVKQALLERLSECGVSSPLARKIVHRVSAHQDIDSAWRTSQELLARIVPVADDSLLQHGGIAALVGSTGVGKTTTVAKLAAQFILKHGTRQIALISTDNYRIGAHEQIHTYGRILDVPVRIAGDADELRAHIDSFADKRLILIDTAGMSQRDMRLAEQLKTLQHGDLPIQTYLVMSAATQHKAAVEIMDAFRMLSPQAAILTKFDEAASKATALSAIIERRMPLAFVTDGQQVPEDIYVPDAAGLVGQCLQGAEAVSDNDATDYDAWLVESHA
ncbi:MAG: flagellar biosynthesis protein FlhF [Methylomonas sp.]|nr:flagellar biosynthesis protein FlhF [Methylomonas sp.]PPD19366.1 MAG: flagellar biosynthesis protein FlhF [Methylomonas sp.]PPD24820.1 MAG: flagellar biosynthesis protein FlhF [Methylomonas sp.]PPD33605.1 MAG: flagellar biosynthesis protein FlhF [Methylomonas sp.]PPD38147.1 MAG: flagellar biosynthesis protein FlhF [Methylomonas sp.]